MATATKNLAPSRSALPANRHDVVWQGWRMEMPARWSPLKLEGDAKRGMALFADLHRPRLGVRWETAPKKFDVAKWVKRAMREEVGQLAADEAKPLRLEQGEWEASTLYLEPEPPGRDVWMGFSKKSNRLFQLIYHAHRRERILPQTLLPTFADLGVADSMSWSIFDLSLKLPQGWPLLQQHLHAGDLSLSFGTVRKPVVVRQVAVADLALQRMSLERWLAAQERPRLKYYRPIGKPLEKTMESQGRDLIGLSRPMRRRRRFFFMRWLARNSVTLALHDKTRNRLVVVQAPDEKLAESVAKSIGWADR
jgi:hypothetical protein